MEPNTAPPKKKFTFPVGMRMVKTAVAAFFCLTIDYFRGQVPFQSVITTAMCIQPDRKDSVLSAVARAIGTLVGAAYGLLVFQVFSHSIGNIHTLLYYLVAAFFMLPMMYTVNRLKVPGGIIVSIVAYTSITMTHATLESSWNYAFHRIVDTFVGIFVALPVNVLLPWNNKPQRPINHFESYVKESEDATEDSSKADNINKMDNDSTNRSTNDSTNNSTDGSEKKE